MTIIVGAGELEKNFKKQAKLLNLQHIYFIGKQKHDVISKLQNISDVLLTPSRYEAFGLVVIETTACGNPVIATNIGGMPDILNIEKKEIQEKESLITPLGILVPSLPERPETIEKPELEETTILYLLNRNNELERNKIIKKCIKNSNTSFDILEKYLEEYMHTVNKISEAVEQITSGEIKFNKEEIADYTRKTYSQDIITEKLFTVFDKAIK